MKPVASPDSRLAESNGPPSYGPENTPPARGEGQEPRATRIPWQRRRRESAFPSSNALLLTVLRLCVVAIFVVAGTAKLFGWGSTVALFDAVGFGQWFRYVTGLSELTGAALLAVPRTTLLGALMLAGLMIGAIGTEMFILRRLPVSSAATLGALGALVWLEIRNDRG